MSRLTLIVLVAFLLVACQPAASIEEATATLPPPTPTDTLLPPTATPLPPTATDTPAPPTATELPPTEPVVLDYERTGVVLLIVSNEFDPVEYNGTRSVLEDNEYEVVVAAFTLQPMIDNEGGPKLEADMLLSDVQVENYDAIVFIGNETLVYSNDPEAHRIAQETVEQGRLLAALCHGPLVLANAGLLEGKQATAWFGFGSDICKKLEPDGAICTYAGVQQDGLIITGKGPTEVYAFAGAIVRLLKEA